MSIDRIDIGGAAARGRPQIPAPSTVVMDESGFQVEDSKERKVVPIPERVQAAIEPGTQVAYPEDHPANNEDLEMDGSGRLMPSKGQILTKPPEALGDVQKGFVTDQDSVKENLRSLTALEEDEVDQTAGVTAVPLPAPVVKELPQIEVTFHLEVGAFVSYYNKVRQQGPWLILIANNHADGERRDRFIPRPMKDADGRPVSMTLVITGEDSPANTIQAIPLGMQFTVDEYDFVVMMMVEESEEEE